MFATISTLGEMCERIGDLFSLLMILNGSSNEDRNVSPVFRAHETL